MTGAISGGVAINLEQRERGTISDKRTRREDNLSTMTLPNSLGTDVQCARQ